MGAAEKAPPEAADAEAGTTTERNVADESLINSLKWYSRKFDSADIRLFVANAK